MTYCAVPQEKEIGFKFFSNTIAYSVRHTAEGVTPQNINMFRPL